MNQSIKRLISFMLAITLVFGLVSGVVPTAYATEDHDHEHTAVAETTAPETTEPEVTEPEATEPETTVPETTAPVVEEQITVEQEAVDASEEKTVTLEDFAGKKVSILGDSISTYVGVSNNTAYNSTIGGNALFYSTRVSTMCICTIPGGSRRSMPWAWSCA